MKQDSLITPTVYKCMYPHFLMCLKFFNNSTYWCFKLALTFVIRTHVVYTILIDETQIKLFNGKTNYEVEDHSESKNIEYINILIRFSFCRMNVDMIHSAVQMNVVITMKVHWWLVRKDRVFSFLSQYRWFFKVSF